jgi:hypothetical protein
LAIPYLLAIKDLVQRVGGSRDYDITPDGKTFLILQPAATTSSGPQSLQIQVVLNWFEDLKQRSSGR